MAKSKAKVANARLELTTLNEKIDLFNLKIIEDKESIKELEEIVWQREEHQGLFLPIFFSFPLASHFSFYLYSYFINRIHCFILDQTCLAFPKSRRRYNNLLSLSFFPSLSSSPILFLSQILIPIFSPYLFFAAKRSLRTKHPKAQLKTKEIKKTWKKKMRERKQRMEKRKHFRGRRATCTRKYCYHGLR